MVRCAVQWPRGDQASKSLRISEWPDCCDNSHMEKLLRFGASSVEATYDGRYNATNVG